jgi:hypothetical protein
MGVSGMGVPSGCSGRSIGPSHLGCHPGKPRSGLSGTRCAGSARIIRDVRRKGSRSFARRESRDHSKEERPACCEPPSSPLKPQHRVSERAMTGILAIVIFLAVIAGLNRYEFGRFD